MYLTYSLILAAIAITAMMLLIKRSLKTFAALLSVALLTLTTSLPAVAAPHLAALGASDEAATSTQQAIEEDLKVTPEGGEYSGLEYTPSKMTGATPMSDDEIENAIAKINGSIEAGVNNGAVILSGRVKDRETAKSVVEQVKKIPGVHEVTFDLGLENKST